VLGDGVFNARTDAVQHVLVGCVFGWGGWNRGASALRDGLIVSKNIRAAAIRSVTIAVLIWIATEQRCSDANSSN
jgi:hypothetical protein